MNDPLLKIFAFAPFPDFYRHIEREFPDMTRPQARRRLHRTLAKFQLPHNSNDELKATHRRLRAYFGTPEEIM